MKIRTLLPTVAVALIAMLQVSLSTASPQIIRDEERRQVYNMNQGWSYLEDDLARVEDLSRTTRQWEQISLPHTWNRTDAIDPVPGYRRSASWYKKSLFIPSSSRDLRYILEFEGVNIVSEGQIESFLKKE